MSIDTTTPTQTSNARICDRTPIDRFCEYLDPEAEATAVNRGSKNISPVTSFPSLKPSVETAAEGVGKR